jgi:hypothetical protein
MTDHPTRKQEEILKDVAKVIREEYIEYGGGSWDFEMLSAHLICDKYIFKTKKVKRNER